MLKKMDQIQVNNALEAPTLKCDFFNGVYMLIGSSKKIWMEKKPKLWENLKLITTYSNTCNMGWKNRLNFSWGGKEKSNQGKSPLQQFQGGRETIM